MKAFNKTHHISKKPLTPDREYYGLIRENEEIKSIFRECSSQNARDNETNPVIKSYAANVKTIRQHSIIH
jgi:hypothetical protein